MHPQLVLENVRCFQGKHRVPLAPLTLLVGENSTGKSTALGMTNFLTTALQVPPQVSLNDPPFQFGNFNDVVYRSREQRETSFSVGYEVPFQTKDMRPVGEPTAPVSLQLVFEGRDAQPRLREWSVGCGDYSVRVNADPSREPGLGVLIETPSGQHRRGLPEYTMGADSLLLISNWNFLIHLLVRGEPDLFTSKEDRPVPLETNDANIIESVLATVGLTQRLASTVASAPIRTKPKRSYDPITDKPSPEGDHIPLLLAKLSSKARDRRWTSLHSEISRFGEVSGMYSDISIRRFAKEDASAPFQVRVTWGDGSDFSLLDVGYGVSQVLPIIVDAVENPEAMLLLQQPEVHLHPRAQASLGTFFADLAARRSGVPIMIETHSDYLIDRIRADIRDGRTNLKAEDVRIVYFTRSGGAVECHSIELDGFGNLVNAPKGYRNFFLEEDRRVLGV